MNCSNCVYCNTDYVWDEQSEEEYEVQSCDNDRDEFENNGENCPSFKEYKPKPYKEQSTACDRCENLHRCISEQNVIDIALSMDNFRHYAKGMGSNCCKLEG